MNDAQWRSGPTQERDPGRLRLSIVWFSIEVLLEFNVFGLRVVQQYTDRLRPSGLNSFTDFGFEICEGSLK
jgi:hypothetical protein